MVKIILSLICNAVIVGWTIQAVIRSARRNNDELGSSAAVFRYFTTDSNLLSGVAALALVVCNALMLTRCGGALPEWAVVLKYMGTAAVAVTFLTVMVFLGPTAGYKLMFAEEGLFLHLIGPIIAIASFCFLETGTKITWAQTLLGVLPTVLYGGLYLVMVVTIGKERGGWEDFYGFNKDGKWPVSLTSMLIGAYALCVLLMLLHNAVG